jgi:hypothetical protein
MAKQKDEPAHEPAHREPGKTLSHEDAGTGQLNPKEENLSSFRERPQAAPDPLKGDLPAAEPKDKTREAVGEFTTPPPGYKAPVQPGGGARPADLTQVPRVCDPNERVGADSKVRRFKVRADVPGETTGTRYILANDEDEAIAHYLAVSGLREKIDRARKASAASPTPVPVLEPQMSVKRLPD